MKATVTRSRGSTDVTFDELVGAVYRRDVATLAKAGRDDVNQTDEDGRTPLMHAILAEHPDPAIVRVLLEKGAEADVADKGERWTALHFAARDEHTGIVGLLLGAGAAVDPVDVFDDTPLWRAVFAYRDDLGTIELLLERGADPARKNCKGVSPLDLATKMGRTNLIELLAKGH